MSREAFESWYAKNHRGVISSTPKEDAQQVWQAAQAEAYERAAKVAAEHDVAPTDDPLGVQECITDAIRALAKKSNL